MTNNPTLFSPVNIGELPLANRIVMAPLTRNRAAEDNVPQALNVEYYRQRASAGLIITEGSQISPQGLGYPNTPGIYSEAQVAGWKQVTEAVHAEGGRIFLQLWHVGRISHSSMQPDGALPVGPSAIKATGKIFTYAGFQDFETPRELAVDDIAAIVRDYRTAAENCLRAGFDGVEIHAANGYLIDQFLRDGTNQRTDEYGGNTENRQRLLLEVVNAVVSVWGRGRVGVRLSPENSFNTMQDINPQATFNAAAHKLSGLDLAYLHVLEGDMMSGASQLDYLELRRHFNGLYIANNGYDFAGGTAALAEGRADMVAYGKLFIANPDLPYRFANQLPLNEPDSRTFYGGDQKGYTDYSAWEKD
jgi:N-ethylmaleimide reductase